jgi:hypothetical protein
MMFRADHIEQDSFEQFFVFNGNDSPTKRQRLEDETSTETDSQPSQNLDANTVIVNNTSSNQSYGTASHISSSSQSPISNVSGSKNERTQKNANRVHPSRTACLQCKHPSSKISMFIQIY